MASAQDKLISALKDVEASNKIAMNLARRLSEINREIAELKAEIAQAKPS